MKMMSGLYWDKGERADNQDSATIQQVMTGRGRAALAVISDGIGGLQEGQVASGYMAEKLITYFYQEILILLQKRRGRRGLQKCMLRCFYECNQKLCTYAGGRQIQLGATLSVLVVWKRQYLVFHLGDSRIYRLDRKGTRQLTTDHSKGSLGLTKCLGSFPFQRPEMKWGHLKKNTGFLLCSDGFYRKVERESMGQMLAPKEIQKEEQIRRRLRDLGEIGRKRGERDNSTAVYLKVW